MRNSFALQTIVKWVIVFFLFNADSSLEELFVNTIVSLFLDSILFKALVVVILFPSNILDSSFVFAVLIVFLNVQVCFIALISVLKNFQVFLRVGWLFQFLIVYLLTLNSPLLSKFLFANRHKVDLVFTWILIRIWIWS